jgi:hypothetical protein
MVDHPIWQYINLQIDALIQFGDSARGMIDGELLPNEQENFVSALCNLKEAKNKVNAAKDKIGRIMHDLAVRKEKEKLKASI